MPAGNAARECDCDCESEAAYDDVCCVVLAVAGWTTTIPVSCAVPRYQGSWQCQARPQLWR